MSYSLGRAVREARRIRRNLLRTHHRRGSDQYLEGDCGIASLLLADALGDVRILRQCYGHVWTKINDTVVDITATQFDRKIRGIYVGPRRDFHGPIQSVGVAVVREVVHWGYYTESCQWARLFDRLM